jgi:hypothetical protein
VIDNLNTHRISSLYEAFPAAEARRLAERLEIHYTPEFTTDTALAQVPLLKNSSPWKLTLHP